MTTARKPPLKPQPKIRRPLAQPKSNGAPDLFTTEVIQRLRREIVRSRGILTVASVGEQIETSQSQLSDWMGFRSTPGGKYLGRIIRLLAQLDSTFVRDVILAKVIKAITPVESVKHCKLTDDQVRTIKSHPGDIQTLKKLAKRFDVTVPMIWRIQQGERYSSIS